MCCPHSVFSFLFVGLFVFFFIFNLDFLTGEEEIVGLGGGSFFLTLVFDCHFPLIFECFASIINNVTLVP